MRYQKNLCVWGLVVLALGLLGACRTTTDTEAKAPASVADITPVLTMPDVPSFKNVDPGTPEELLAAEGNWNIVEEGDVYDPKQAHINARKRVNTRQMKKRSDLIAHFEPEPPSGRDGKFRVLRMQPQGAGAIDDLTAEPGFEVAETSITKPSQKVVGRELVAQIRRASEQALTSEAASEPLQTARVAQSASGVPVPGRKPLRPGVSPSMAAAPPSVVPPPETLIAQAEPEFRLRPAQAAPAAKLRTQQPQKLDQPKPGFLGTLRRNLLGAEQEPDPRPVKTAAAPQAAPAPSQNTLQPKPAQPVPAAKPNVRYQIISSGQATAGTARLVGFRSALHQGRVRVAMDVTKPVRYKVAIDHIRNVLRVKLEKTDWQEPLTGTMRASGLLGTYVAKEQADGSVILEIRLKSKAKIADTMMLMPDQGRNHRIVIDLQS